MMQTLLEAGELELGTMDCWLLQKMSGGRAFITEPSSASSTGMFDPFTVSKKQIIFPL
jgi:glycerol kinase